MFSTEQLDRYHQKLQQLRADLQSMLEDSSGSDDVVTLDQSRVGRLSRLDAIQQQQMAKASRSAYKQRLMKVEQVLREFDDGYGYCEECGEEINPRRLEVYPETLLCITCQTIEENG